MRFHELLAESARLDILHQIINPDLKALRALFQKHDRDIRLVGGAVRDILNGQKPKDIDLATDATPEEQIRIYEDALFGHANHEHSAYGKYIKTGIDHGTITVICYKQFAGYGSGPYEITSLRTESEHDGRRAKVAYTHDWVEDLSRRDLTVNAMALTFDGELVDPFGGQHDLKRGIVKFVGRAADRIGEDYLRILRFFRFHGRLHSDGHYDPETEQAIKEKAAGLQRISGERIWMEMAKILAGPNGPGEYHAMCELGVAKTIGLPCHKFREMKAAYDLTKHPVSLLAAILDSPEEVDQLAARWKLKNEDKDLLGFLVEHKPAGHNLDAMKDLAIGGAPLSWIAELALINGKKGEALSIAHWKIPAFPVGGKDLAALGMEPGPAMGQMLRDLKQKWIKSRFELTRDQMLASAKRSLGPQAGEMV
jgi:tRNA nucleotidyltransferase (CCA-adding enzyme)